MSIPSSAGVTVEIKVPVTMWLNAAPQADRAAFKVSTSGSRIRLERAEFENDKVNVIELDKNGLEAALAMLGTLQDVI